jgi:Glycosyltransferase family 87
MGSETTRPQSPDLLFTQKQPASTGESYAEPRRQVATRRARAFERVERWVLVACVAVVVVGFALTRPLSDFVGYWAAGHQIIARLNPYSLPQILRLERSLGWTDPLPFVNLSPPWVWPLIAPLGFAKSYELWWMIWVALMAFVLWWSTRALLDIYAPGRRVFPSESYASEAILGFTFYPSLVCLKLAQITPLVLLGLTCFLLFEARRRDVLAGMCLALTAIKPQLVYLVWLAVLLACWKKRNWTLVLSCLSAIALLTAIAALMRPAVFADYWELSRSEYVRIWPCAMGAILRYPFSSDRAFALQFAAPLVGTIWFLFHWRKHGKEWAWKEQLPILVTISVLTTAYGWIFDQVLLVLPIVAIAAHYTAIGKLPREMVAVYTGVNILLVFGLTGLIFSTAFAFVVAPVAMVPVLFRLVQNGQKNRPAYAWSSRSSP